MASGGNTCAEAGSATTKNASANAMRIMNGASGEGIDFMAILRSKNGGKFARLSERVVFFSSLIPADQLPWITTIALRIITRSHPAITIAQTTFFATSATPSRTDRTARRPIEETKLSGTLSEGRIDRMPDMTSEPAQSEAVWRNCKIWVNTESTE